MTVQGVYLAYPIDNAPPASMVHLYQQINKIKELMRDEVGWVFDPGDAFQVSRGAPLDDTLPRINRCALSNADLVVAFLPHGVASVGVPMEIDRAVSLGKHVILFSDLDAWMLSWGPANRRIVRYRNFEDASILDAIDFIRQLQPLSTDRDPDPLYVTTKDDALMPTRAYGDDAGLDLTVAEDTVVPVGGFVDVPAGCAVACPPGTWALITGRSSAFRRRGLLVLPGVIDGGYRGPLFAGVWNSTDMQVELTKGERIAQLIVINNQTRRVEPLRVPNLPPSERGSNGFGSTGE